MEVLLEPLVLAGDEAVIEALLRAPVPPVLGVVSSILLGKHPYGQLCLRDLLKVNGSVALGLIHIEAQLRRPPGREEAQVKEALAAVLIEENDIEVLE